MAAELFPPEGDQVYVYGPLGGVVMSTVAVPLLFPQEAGVEVTDVDKLPELVTLTVCVLVHPLLSVTVTE